MTNAINNYFITNPEDLNYISNVANQVLESRHNLADIKDVQAALKEVSLEGGREVQINLVFDENQLTGFNFSFKNNPGKTTQTIPFKQQQINIDPGKGDVIPYKQPVTTIDIAAVELKGKLTIPSASSSKIVLTPGLQVEGQRIINPDDSEISETLKSPSPGFGKINPSLTTVANQLTNQHEVNGLFLTGLTLKTGISLVEIQAEEKPDVQTAGLVIIKRLQQVLPQEFINFKTGDSPKAFNWKDPESNKQYHFCFEAAQTNASGDILTPASLKGYEKISSHNSIQPVFAATLIDAKYNRWSIEQCDFNKSQVQSLNLATKLTHPNHSTALTNAVDNFSYEF